MKIVCLKLITGEDIIGRLSPSMMSLTEDVNSLSGKITLSQTRVISLQELPGGRMAMALLPFVMGNHDADVTIDLDTKVFFTYTAIAPIEDSYIQQTSPVDLSSKSKIQLS